MRVRCERVDCYRAHNLQTLRILFNHVLVARQKGSLGGRDARAESRERLGLWVKLSDQQNGQGRLDQQGKQKATQKQSHPSYFAYSKRGMTMTECSGRGNRRSIDCFVANSSRSRRHGD